MSPFFVLVFFEVELTKWLYRFYLKLGYELVPSQEGEYYALDIDKFLGE